MGRRVLEWLKWGALIGAIMFMLMVPAIVGVIVENGLPTARELCKGHGGVKTLDRRGRFLNIDETTALCRDGYTGQVKPDA